MKRIGNYTVEDEPIGKGGMGQVLRGTDYMGNAVAIKEILPQFVRDAEFRQRIEKEISFLKQLSNKNVVKVYDHFESGGNLYIVMELVEGLNIEQYVAQNGPVPWQKAVNYMIKLLDTMQYVHEMHIVHRDIKPGNIMLRPNDEICLLDFGVAKDVSANPKTGGTVFGTVIGTDGYMSPEQAEGFSIDHRADIYALGCVLHFMLTGDHAFGTGISELAMHIAISSGNFPRLNEKVKGLPKALQQVLDAAVEKNMMKRYQSCREFAQNLARLLPNGTQINPPAEPSKEIKLSVGRENCDVCIGVSNYKVSRHHADIELHQNTGGGNVYVYTDCSSNGTVINGAVLTRGQSYVIHKGQNPEILLAGDPECRLEVGEIIRVLDSRLANNRSVPESGDDSKGRSAKNPRTYNGVPGNVQPDARNRCAKQDNADSLFGAAAACFRNYAGFSGRCARAEYWWFVLFNVLVSVVCVSLFLISDYAPAFLYLYGAYSLASFVPSLAVFWRRMHDTGTSGAYYFLSWLPLVGIYFAIMILIKLCSKGTPGSNKYGPSPCGEGLSYRERFAWKQAHWT